MFLNHKYLIAAGVFIFAGVQTVQAQKDLPTENVNVIKAFDARLLESSKIKVLPSLPPLDTTTHLQDYLVPQRPLSLKYDAPKLRPIGMKAGKKEETYNGFVKLGGGVPTAIWGEAGYSFKIGKQFDGNVWFRHHNQNADNALANQRFANNDGLISGNYYINDKVAVEGKIGYKYDRVHFYGYNHDSLKNVTEDRVRQDYKILDIGGRVYNAERNDIDLNYSIAPKFYLMNDNYGARETGFDLLMSATKWFAEKHPLRIAIRTDFTSFSDTVSRSLNNIYLQPSFTLHFDILKLKIGGNFASNRDVFSVFPDCELGLSVFEDGFQIFAGATGDLKKNTYRSMATYNPYIQMLASTLRNTKVNNYYGGIKGDFGWLEYSGQVGYSKSQDLALYQTFYGTNKITRFRTIYDTVSMTPTIQARAWGLPKLEGNFGGVYTLLDGKASLRGNCYIADGIWYKDRENHAQQGKILLDLGFGGSYYFTKNIGAFLDVNNILNNKRARWADYPTIGTNFLAGITVKF
jgi:hypothetical protein